MIVRLARPLKQKILSAKAKLKQLQEQRGETYFINPQLPDAMLAEKKVLHYEIKRIKDYNEVQQNKEDKLNFFVKDTQLYIEEEPHVQLIFPPKPTDLFASEAEQEKMDEMLMGTSLPKTKSGSIFVGAAIPAMNLEEVNRAYRKVRQMYPSFDHVMMAYRLKDSSGYQDDGEHSAGIRLHSLLYKARKKHIAIFVARNFGGANLGPKHFDYIEEVAEQALCSLMDIAEYVPAPVQERSNPASPAGNPMSQQATQQQSQQQVADQGPQSHLQQDEQHPFNHSPAPQEEWPAETSSQWDFAKNLDTEHENFLTPASSQEENTDSDEESQSENEITIRKL